MQLHEIQKTLKAPKNQRNTFGNYNYRNAEDILEAVKPLLGESILIISDEIVQVGNRYYVKATATFQCGEQTTIAYGWAREPENRKGMDESQITGATSSYARKYALNGLFILDDTKDADNGPPPQRPQGKPQNKPAAKPAQKPAKPPADAASWAELKAELKTAGIDEGDRETASACIDYVTSGRLSLGKAYADAKACKDVVNMLKSANLEYHSDHSEPLLVQVRGHMEGGK